MLTNLPISLYFGNFCNAFVALLYRNAPVKQFLLPSDVLLCVTWRLLFVQRLLLSSTTLYVHACTRPCTHSPLSHMHPCLPRRCCSLYPHSLLGVSPTMILVLSLPWAGNSPLRCRQFSLALKAIPPSVAGTGTAVLLAIINAGPLYVAGTGTAVLLAIINAGLPPRCCRRRLSKMMVTTAPTARRTRVPSTTPTINPAGVRDTVGCGG